MAWPAAGGMIGSSAPQSSSLGRGSAAMASRTARPAAAPGASGVVGRISGNARGPALNDASGNGAS